jgi:Mg/Co/Ni transporter MgtE
LSDVGERASQSGSGECVVVNDAGIVLGLLRKAAWQGGTNGMSVEQSMEPGPATFRPHVPVEEMTDYMEKKKLSSALVTTSEGKLIGLIRCAELKRKTPAHEHGAHN